MLVEPYRPSYSLAQLRGEDPRLMNLVAGAWTTTRKYHQVFNPLTGEAMLQMPDPGSDELQPFLDSLQSCPGYGLHNPLYNTGHYLMLGEVCFQAAAQLENPELAEYFAKLIQMVMPKSDAQCLGEVNIIRTFLKNFSGDQPRFLASGFTSSGDRPGQMPHTLPWPLGPVAIVAPFNFPAEIPVLQLVGALLMGNKPLIKCATPVSVVIEEFVRLLIHCGLPSTDVDLIHCKGRTMNELFSRGIEIIKMVQFTGSSEVAEQLAELFHGRVKLEDAGFDWAVYGPDFNLEMLEFVARQADLDAYAASGQKCSARSISFVHGNWWNVLIPQLQMLAAERLLTNLTIGPVLSHTTQQMLDHLEKLMQLPGSELLFGGLPLTGHSIPDCYGAIAPTAVEVSLDAMMANDEAFELVTTEIFGPFQVLVRYTSGQLPMIFKALDRMKQHLTAGVISNDPQFLDEVLGHTVNGVTYYGYLARTTGAPQNHLFGPAGDIRAAGIGSPESIINTWSTPRCLIKDTGPFNRAELRLPAQS